MTFLPLNPARTAGMPALCLLALSLLAGCGQAPQAEPAPVPQVQGQTIHFQANSPQLELLRSEPAIAAAQNTLSLPARLAWDDTRTSYLRAPLPGQIAALDVTLGQAVKRGQTLAWITSPEFGQLQADGARGNAALRQAEAELKRVEELHGAGVASGRELDEARTAAAGARADSARARAVAQAFGNGGHVDQRLPLRTPIDGVLVERNMSPGQAVGPDGEGRPLATVSDPNALWLVVDVPESLAGRLAPGQSVRVQAGGQTLQAQLQHVADFVDPETRTVQARAQIDNHARLLKAGQYVRAQIALPVNEGVTVPAAAVLLSGQQRLVFVEEAPGRFRRQPVQAEEIDGARLWIRQGVATGAKVVVDGSLLLQQVIDRAAVAPADATADAIEGAPAQDTSAS